jgi:hypothetical protein
VRVAAAAFLCALLISVPVAAETYVNPRFGTTLDVPAEVFSQPQPPPDNGDGQRWRAPDRAELAVFGSYNALEQAPADFFAELVASRKQLTKLTYSRVEDRWGVVSGFAGQEVYYEKYLFGAGDEIIHGLILRYPAALKAKYDPLVGPIANSLDGP